MPVGVGQHGLEERRVADPAKPAARVDPAEPSAGGQVLVERRLELVGLQCRPARQQVLVTVGAEGVEPPTSAL